MVNNHYVIQGDSWFDGDWEMKCYNHPEFNGSASSEEGICRQLFRLNAGIDLDSPFFPEDDYIKSWLASKEITYEIVGTRSWITDAEKLDKLSKFPVELRTMWTGQEVQDWINEILEE